MSEYECCGCDDCTGETARRRVEVLENELATTKAEAVVLRSALQTIKGAAAQRVIAHARVSFDDPYDLAARTKLGEALDELDADNK